ncbi:ELL-associated factor 2 isoform X2 [Arabidopsis lyrata subsp. lyrata]|uniref:ELL-associated factor 2 isoform X2 n=1 Tax=Arabidopsis lyrata subsp. lyrata TaxID=81972 RepID=UPI000A29A555|nr:ELL-associated factor 2 isoform X2 [Arabidopsis lyrata subsp. lyrata]|eukprot:XP_020889710.1 ELL-associated factor 2 isoform X2 [Arabidopsis lyrata subsp. lyrata]
MSNHSIDEPSTAPKTDQWYDLVLGSSAKDDSSHKFCTLRYEFKPASIDKNRSGTLHKKKDNRVSVEFQNNQHGKPKVTFEGSSEDYKEHDAVLFFDGEKFRLERLHRAVKQLRHLRTPGESAAASSQAAMPVEHNRLSPVDRAAKSPQVNRSLLPDVPVEVERIEIGKPENSVVVAAEPAIAGNVSAASPVDDKNDDGDEHHEIDLIEIFGSFTPENDNVEKENADGGEYVESLNKQLSMTEEEIADVDDDSGGEGEKGLNAAEALRAQVNAEVQKSQTSSSTSSSGSSSGSDSDGRSKSVSSGSGSGGQSSSGSSSRGSGGSDDEDEVNSV